MNIVLTDNGGEFAKHLAALMAKEEITRLRTYPRTPKMNAHVERFNRTIQDEFVNYFDDLLFTERTLFNDKLIDWLSWYNTRRHHHSLGLQSPLQYIAHFFNNPECNMYWPNTVS